MAALKPEIKKIKCLPMLRGLILKGKSNLSHNVNFSQNRNNIER